MPVTTTAKRALRSSRRKMAVNKAALNRLEIAIRQAKKLRKKDKVTQAISYVDRAVKNKIIHKNKGARIKSTLSKIMHSPKPKKS